MPAAPALAGPTRAGQPGAEPREPSLVNRGGMIHSAPGLGNHPDPQQDGNSMRTRLRFHWSLSQAGDPSRRARSLDQQSGVPPLAYQIELCRTAEQCGIDSMLMAIGYTRPDPLVLSIAL